eukprot:GHVL01012751.1.p1 GENE.GHVL01012751.1~~GHVL01012751.1.p1  ORF type:complete len:1864 (+),score=302.02 GHVL01012751.1:1583-7174(+)
MTQFLDLTTCREYVKMHLNIENQQQMQKNNTENIDFEKKFKILIESEYPFIAKQKICLMSKIKNLNKKQGIRRNKNKSKISFQLEPHVRTISTCGYEGNCIDGTTRQQDETLQVIQNLKDPGNQQLITQNPKFQIDLLLFDRTDKYHNKNRTNKHSYEEETMQELTNVIKIINNGALVFVAKKNILKNKLAQILDDFSFLFFVKNGIDNAFNLTKQIIEQSRKIAELLAINKRIKGAENKLINRRLPKKTEVKPQTKIIKKTVRVNNLEFDRIKDDDEAQKQLQDRVKEILTGRFRVPAHIIGTVNLSQGSLKVGVSFVTVVDGETSNEAQAELSPPPAEVAPVDDTVIVEAVMEALHEESFKDKLVQLRKDDEPLVAKVSQNESSFLNLNEFNEERVNCESSLLAPSVIQSRNGAITSSEATSTNFNMFEPKEQLCKPANRSGSCIDTFNYFPKQKTKASRSTSLGFQNRCDVNFISTNNSVAVFSLSQRKKLENDLSSTIQRLEEEQHKNIAAKKEHDRLLKKIRDLQINATNTKNVIITKEMSTITSENQYDVDQLHSEIIHAQQELFNSRSEMNHWKELTTGLQKDIAESRQRHSTISKEMEELSLWNHDESKKIQKYTQEILSLRKEATHLQISLEANEEMVRCFVASVSFWRGFDLGQILSSLDNHDKGTLEPHIIRHVFHTLPLDIESEELNFLLSKSFEGFYMDQIEKFVDYSRWVCERITCEGLVLVAENETNIVITTHGITLRGAFNAFNTKNETHVKSIFFRRLLKVSLEMDNSEDVAQNIIPPALDSLDWSEVCACFRLTKSPPTICKDPPMTDVLLRIRSYFEQDCIPWLSGFLYEIETMNPGRCVSDVKRECFHKILMSAKIEEHDIDVLYDTFQSNSGGVTRKLELTFIGEDKTLRRLELASQIIVRLQDLNLNPRDWVKTTQTVIDINQLECLMRDIEIPMSRGDLEFLTEDLFTIGNKVKLSPLLRRIESCQYDMTKEECRQFLQMYSNLLIGKLCLSHGKSEDVGSIALKENWLEEALAGIPSSNSVIKFFKICERSEGTLRGLCEACELDYPPGDVIFPPMYPRLKSLLTSGEQKESSWEDYILYEIAHSALLLLMPLSSVDCQTSRKLSKQDVLKAGSDFVFKYCPHHCNITTNFVKEDFNNQSQMFDTHLARLAERLHQMTDTFTEGLSILKSCNFKKLLLALSIVPPKHDTIILIMRALCRNNEQTNVTRNKSAERGSIVDLDVGLFVKTLINYVKHSMRSEFEQMLRSEEIATYFNYSIKLRHVSLSKLLELCVDSGQNGINDVTALAIGIQRCLGQSENKLEINKVLQLQYLLPRGPNAALHLINYIMENRTPKSRPENSTVNKLVKCKRLKFKGKVGESNPNVSRTNTSRPISKKSSNASDTSSRTVNQIKKNTLVELEVENERLRKLLKANPCNENNQTSQYNDFSQALSEEGHCSLESSVGVYKICQGPNMHHSGGDGDRKIYNNTDLNDLKEQLFQKEQENDLSLKQLNKAKIENESLARKLASMEGEMVHSEIKINNLKSQLDQTLNLVDNPFIQVHLCSNIMFNIQADEFCRHTTIEIQGLKNQVHDLKKTIAEERMSNEQGKEMSFDLAILKCQIKRLSTRNAELVSMSKEQNKKVESVSESVGLTTKGSVKIKANDAVVAGLERLVEQTRNENTRLRQNVLRIQKDIAKEKKAGSKPLANKQHDEEKGKKNRSNDDIAEIKTLRQKLDEEKRCRQSDLSALLEAEKVLEEVACVEGNYRDIVAKYKEAEAKNKIMEDEVEGLKSRLNQLLDQLEDMAIYHNNYKQVEGALLSTAEFLEMVRGTVIGCPGMGKIVNECSERRQQLEDLLMIN